MKARLTLLLFACCRALTAQYTSLSTDFEGSVLFFTTDFAQAGTGQPTHGKVFHTDADGVRPLAIRGREQTRLGNNPSAYTTNAYDLIGVDVSSNGKRVAVTAYRECVGLAAALCGAPNKADIYNDRGELIHSTDGFVSLSPDGAWGLSTNVTATSPFSVVRLFNFSREGYDQTSGTGNPYWRWHKAANYGIAVQVLGGVLSIIRNTDGRGQFGSSGLALFGHRFTSATIDASGSTVVWSEPDSIRAFDVGARQETRRIDVATEWVKSSDDGTRILFLSKVAGQPQIFTALTEAGPGGSDTRCDAAEKVVR